MKFFLILLTVSFLNLQVFANSVDIKIVAIVNNQVITNIDAKQRLDILTLSLPTMKKLTYEQQIVASIQHIVSDILKKDYSKRVSVTVSDEELEAQIVAFKNVLMASDIDVEMVEQKYQSFVKSEAYWNAVVAKIILPHINVSNGMVAKIASQNPSKTEDEIRAFIIQQQADSQTNQIIESMKKVSVVELKEENFNYI